MRDTEREAERHRQGEKQTLCGEPDAGLNPRTQDHTLSQRQTSTTEPPRHPLSGFTFNPVRDKDNSWKSEVELREEG